MSKENRIRSLKGKIKISAVLKLETGLHIGSSNDFAPIGAVDSPFIRDPYTKQPIVPGSSIKGKIRTLLARSMSNSDWLNDIDQDCEKIKNLFGTAEKNAPRASRLQFSDLAITAASLENLETMDLDTYIGEVKFENSINRITAIANPRQIERVPAGTEFSFSVVYNVEDKENIKEDIQLLADGIKLLQLDYLGGHGSRGYGRVSFRDCAVEAFSLDRDYGKQLADMTQELTTILEGCC